MPAFAFAHQSRERRNADNPQVSLAKCPSYAYVSPYTLPSSLASDLIGALQPAIEPRIYLGSRPSDCLEAGQDRRRLVGDLAASRRFVGLQRCERLHDGQVFVPRLAADGLSSRWTVYSCLPLGPNNAFFTSPPLACPGCRWPLHHALPITCTYCLLYTDEYGRAQSGRGRRG
jgi:hypothetical protein